LLYFCQRFHFRHVPPFQKVTICFVISVPLSLSQSALNKSAHARRIFMRFILEEFSKIYGGNSSLTKI